MNILCLLFGHKYTMIRSNYNHHVSAEIFCSRCGKYYKEALK